MTQWPLHPEKPGQFPPLPLYDGEKVINPNLSHRDMEQLYDSIYRAGSELHRAPLARGRSSFYVAPHHAMCRSP
jgi:hypothetical protein